MHGGNRKGAGRPHGSGKFKGEPTKLLRVPVSILEDVRKYRDELFNRPSRATIGE